MVFAEWHVFALPKDFEDILLVVLAARAKEHSRFLLLLHELLQCSERRIQPNAFGAILAAYAAPKRVVTVQGDHFIGWPFEGVELASDGCGEGAEKERSIRDMAQLV